MGLFTIAIPLWLGCSYAWYRFTTWQAKKELAAPYPDEDYIKTEFLFKNILGAILLFFLSMLMVVAWQIFVVVGFLAAVVIGFVAFLLRQWTKSVKTDEKAK